MNWECSLLNKIYKTMDFKLKNCNILALQQQKEQRKLNKKPEEKLKTKQAQQVVYENTNSFPTIVSGLLIKYNLHLANYKSNKRGAIYKKKENGHCVYFDYFANYMFYQFCHFFQLDEKYISKKQFNKINIDFKAFLEKLNLQYDGPVENSFYYFTFLMFFNRNDKNLSEKFFTLIDFYLESQPYLNGNQPTSHDIVCLSTFYNSETYSQKEVWRLKYPHIETWFNLLESTLEIKYFCL